MSLEPIAARLQHRLVLADGAMGTLLFSRAASSTSCVELLNLDEPETVERAHRAYIDAGAELIESNTFAGNRIKLGKHELAQRLEEINRAGVRIARQAAADAAYVAGSVGPLGALMRPIGSLDRGEALAIFEEHIAAVAAERPDLLILETFGDVGEALLALEAAKSVAGTLPVIVSLSVMDDGKTPSGDTLGTGFAKLRAGGADGVGVNCAAGPQVVFDSLVPVIGQIDCPVSVMPNAGYPERIDDRAVYRSSPSYFRRFARDFVSIGANIIGGCCGTTPEHIEAMAAEVVGKSPHRRATVDTTSSGALSGAVDLNRPTVDQRPPIRATFVDRALTIQATPTTTAFERKLGREFVISVELPPPRGIDYSASLEYARSLERAGADAVHISDNPTARLRLSGVAFASLVGRATRLATILHFSGRDRNLLALQSELLGAGALGVTGIVALTGDPNTFGDFPKATSVFDVTALGLTQIISALNSGRDHAGTDIGSATRFRIGAATNPAARDLDAELARLAAKIDAGADFIVTQPVFETKALQKFVERVERFHIPLLAGTLFLRDAQNAEFLHNEVPGMSVPEQVRERMRAASNGPAEGAAIVSELLGELARTAGVAGAYLMPQERYKNAAEVIKTVRAAGVAAR